LIDAQLVVSSGAAGTHVARRAPLRPRSDAAAITAVRDPIADYPHTGGVFQMGIPAQDAFPAKVWSRILLRAARTAASAVPRYPDPRGEPALRTEIAACLAVARGMACNPAQIFVTGGHAAAIALAVHTLGIAGTAWAEDPGYLPTRRVLAALGIASVPVPVDAEGLDVAAGIATAPHAAMAMVTPGQQAPLGVALSPARRRALLDWAAAAGAWVVEDDYLGELQLQGRAAPSLAARDTVGRVLCDVHRPVAQQPALAFGRGHEGALDAQHMVDPRLQRRRHGVVVHRRADDDCIGAFQFGDEVLRAHAGARHARRSACQCMGIVAIDVRQLGRRKIAQHDVGMGVARTQPLDDGIGEARAVRAIGARTAEDVQDVHAATPRAIGRAKRMAPASSPCLK
ncbi:MAG: aminotransferase class I/II-fold pyridoxal phosphate-dependent enzyme, partial [Pseudomonadota bacterium]